MKKHLLTLLTFVASVVGLSGCGNNEPGPDPVVDTYYESINADSKTLLKDLRALNKAKLKKTVGYGALPTVYKSTDVDPKTKKIVGFYDNHLLGPSWDSGKTWNREHVWPKSLGGDNVEADAHMARPAWVDSNSDRGNKAYAEYNAYDPADLGIENYRGISARIIFYCVVAHASLSLVDSTNCSTGSNKMGKLSDLLKWNIQYPPTRSENAALELVIEQQRNNVIESKYQGNRNPFIDHPEYACKIWGNTNAATRKACGL